MKTRQDKDLTESIGSTSKTILNYLDQSNQVPTIQVRSTLKTILNYLNRSYQKRSMPKTILSCRGRLDQVPTMKETRYDNNETDDTNVVYAEKETKQL